MIPEWGTQISFLASGLLCFWYGFLVGFCNGRRVLLRFRWPIWFKARKVAQGE